MKTIGSLCGMLIALAIFCGDAAGQSKRSPSSRPSYQPPPATPIPDCSTLGLGCDSFNQLVRAGDEDLLQTLDTRYAEPGDFTYICFPQSYKTEGLDYFETIQFSREPTSRETSDFFYSRYQDGQLNESLIQFLYKNKSVPPSQWGVVKSWKSGPLLPKEDWFQVFVDSTSASLSYRYFDSKNELVRASEDIRVSTLRVSENLSAHTWEMHLSGQCVSYPLRPDKPKDTGPEH